MLNALDTIVLMLCPHNAFTNSNWEKSNSRKRNRGKKKRRKALIKWGSIKVLLFY